MALPTTMTLAPCLAIAVGFFRVAYTSADDQGDFDMLATAADHFFPYGITGATA